MKRLGWVGVCLPVQLRFRSLGVRPHDKLRLGWVAVCSHKLLRFGWVEVHTHVQPKFGWVGVNLEVGVNLYVQPDLVSSSVSSRTAQVKLEWTSFFDVILWVGVRPHEKLRLGRFQVLPHIQLRVAWVRVHPRVQLRVGWVGVHPHEQLRLGWVGLRSCVQPTL